MVHVVKYPKDVNIKYAVNMFNYVLTLWRIRFWNSSPGEVVRLLGEFQNWNELTLLNPICFKVGNNLTKAGSWIVWGNSPFSYLNCTILWKYIFWYVISVSKCCTEVGDNNLQVIWQQYFNQQTSRSLKISVTKFMSFEEEACLVFEKNLLSAHWLLKYGLHLH